MEVASFDDFTVDQRMAQLESGCRTTKVAMGRARDEVKEQAYYRLQLRARHARSDIDVWEKGIGWLYSVSSDFGSSLSRPLLVLVALTAVFGLIYGIWGAWLSVPGSGYPDGVWHGLGFALRGVFPPFSAMTIEPKPPGTVAASWQSLFTGVNPAVTFGVRSISALQSILSGVLLFLFAVAVRRRFQIS